MSDVLRFGAPVWLLLFLLTPLIAWLGWPSRGRSRRREIVSLVLRLLLFAALVLGLARLEAVRGSDDVAVVYLVDVSDSMPAQAQALAVQWVRDSLAAMGPDDQAAVVLFGADALVEQPMRAVSELAPFSSVPTTLETDLEEAIRLGLALFPGGYGKRMVILSDGAETTGTASEAVQLAAASGVEISAVAFQADPGAELLVTEVDAPTLLRQGEAFDLEVTVESTVTTQAELRVFAGETLVYSGTHDFEVGRNSLLVPLTASETGFTRFRVQVVPLNGNDGYYQNNELAAFSNVQGPPRVLVVAAESADITNPALNLVQALETTEFVVEIAGPGGLPADLAALAEYASVVLVDVPARQLSSRQELALEQYVRDLGGGLVVIGGPQSFGVGGYYDTPLERTLPVDMQLKDEERRPRLAMVFIIDKSGSMTDTAGGVSKLELAKEAAIRSIELLSPSDQVGVIAFDDAAQWVVPITPLDDPDDVIYQVSTIRSGGGTDILAGVQAMAGALPDVDASLKHVILLTDGGASEVGIPDLVERLYTEQGITLSTVGVGQGAAAFLPELAELGGGRYHATDRPESIPEIFTEETVLATRAYIIEEEFFPILGRAHPIISGIPLVPSLRGYVGTSAKDAAQVVLLSDLEEGYQDPILATWQYGLGRAVAWTSDATGRWATNWVNWPDFPRFWAQTVRYTVSSSLNVDLSANVRRDGELAVLTVDALDRDGNYLNGAALQASIVSPDGTSALVDMQQVAPGQYEATFMPTEEGAYLVRVAGDEASNAGQTTGWVLSYSPEYRQLAGDAQNLARLAAATGGELLTDPAAAFTHNLSSTRDVRPWWPGLLLFAALLLPVDIAVRRLAVTREDFRRAGVWLRSRFVIDRPATAPQTTEAGSRLMAAKQRAQSRESEVDTAEKPAVVVPRQPAVRPRPPAAQPATPTGAKPAPAARQAQPEPEKPPLQAAPAPERTTSALLARKRARRGQDDD